MGKKSPKPPPAPDYTGAAIAQGQANIDAARLTARLSNPNVSTPLGGQRVTFGRRQVNQQAYDAALAAWKARNPQASTPPQPSVQPSAQPSALPATQPSMQPPLQLPTDISAPPDRTDFAPRGPYSFEGENRIGGPTGDIYRIAPHELDQQITPSIRREREDYTQIGGGIGGTLPYGGYGPPPTAPGYGGGPDVMPTPEMFMETIDPDTPFIEQYLTPEAQATLEAQQRVERALSGLGEQAIGKVSDIYKDTFRPQGLPQQQFQLTGYGEVPEMPKLSQLGQFQRGFDVSALPTTPNLASLGMATGGPAAPSQIVGADLGGVRGVSYGPFEGMYGFARGDVAPRDLMEGVDTRGLARMPVSAGVTGQEAILSRLTPQLQRERAALENQLRNQGLVPGGEAYNREIELFNQRANDLLQQSALQGITLDAQMRAQGFSERQIQAEIANRAREAEFGMGVSSSELYNRAVQQNLNQGMSLSEARNRAQAQDFQQRLTMGQFGREGQQIAFQMMREEADARNRALQQNLDIMSRQYEMDVGRQAQEFAQRMDLAGLYNASLAADIQRQLQETQAAAGLQGQRFNQAQAAANFANAQRQAALQEQLALRAQPLNEIAAIMGGAQVQMPQFQAYQGADVAAAPIFGATQAAGNFAQQTYGNQVAKYNALMGLYGNIAGALGTAAASDRRLKSNVVRVGTHPLGIGIYEYDIFGKRQRGVMADEVEAVKPEAVTTHPTEGYKMVYYEMLR